MKTTGWGILGCGHIAGKFASDLAGTPGSGLTACWRRDAAQAEAFAREHGGAAVSRREELVNHPQVDAVYVATPHHRHLDDVRACLEAGKAVLCEKPFGMDSAEAASVLALARAKGLFLMEALWTRFLPHFLKADGLVKAGEIGEIGLLEADFGFLAPYRMDSRLFAPESGGTLWDIGIYPLFLARHFLGEPSEVAALADRAGTGVDRRLTMGLNFAQGAHARLFSSFMEKTPCAATLHGSRGALRFEGPFHAPTDLVLTRAGGGAERFGFPREGYGYRHEILHVQECLAKGLAESPMWTHEDTLGLLRLMERTAAAADRGNPRFPGA